LFLHYNTIFARAEEPIAGRGIKDAQGGRPGRICGKFVGERRSRLELLGGEWYTMRKPGFLPAFW